MAIYEVALTSSYGSERIIADDMYIKEGVYFFVERKDKDKARDETAVAAFPLAGVRSVVRLDPSARPVDPPEGAGDGWS